MSINVKFNTYSEFASEYQAFGYRINELPSKLIDKIDAFFQGKLLSANSDYNPDNFYVNLLQKIDIEDDHVENIEEIKKDVLSAGNYWLGLYGSNIYYIHTANQK